MPDAQSVNQYFSEIAPDYDLANRVMSSGVDILWRRFLARKVAASQPQLLLDLATGSGDVAFTLARRVPSAHSILAMDFCQPMLDVALKKQMRLKNAASITFQQGDCLNLPLDSDSFDAVTIAFGLRNLEDRQRGLSEMLRVLKPGGKLYVLEFSQPAKWIKGFYYFYLRRIIPLISGTITGSKHAYEYLGSSIASFPTLNELTEELHEAGFESIQAHRLTFSIAALHEARKGGKE